MSMKMGAGKLLSADLEKVLELLEYRFSIRDKRRDQQGESVVRVEHTDLKKAGLSPKEFEAALKWLTEVFPEIKTVAIRRDPNDNLSAVINVPSHFEKLVKTILQSYDKSIHIVIDDTPTGANWRSLHLRFTDGRTLLASFPMSGWHKSIGAGELGLEKIGGTRPKEQWLILKEAAGSSGQINLPSNGKAKESKRKQINTLQHLLNAVFPKLAGQPFEPRGGDGYQTVFEILPEQEEDPE